MDQAAGVFREALTAQGAGDLNRAAALYGQVLTEQPQHAQALNNLGTILFATGKPADALVRFRQAVAADPSYADAVANLGKALGMTGQWTAAVPALREARRLGSGDPDVVRALVSGLRQLAGEAAARADWAQAGGHWQALLRLAADHPAALFGLAHCLYVTGDSAGAISMYERALSIVPSDTAGWTNLGALREAAGDLAAAEAAYRTVLVHQANQPVAAYNLGRLLLISGRVAEAREVLAPAASAMPDDMDLQVTMVEACAASGDVAGAEVILHRLVANPAEAHRAWLVWGNVHQGMDRLDAAAEAYEKAVQLEPGYLPALHNLGSVRMAMGDLDAAVAAFDRAQRLAFDPGIAFRSALMLPPMMGSISAIKAARKRYQRGLDELRRQRLVLGDPVKEVGSTSFYLAYHGVNDRQLQEETAKVYLDACPQLGWQAPHVGVGRQPGERLRVGFASTFLRRHTIGRLFGQFIKRLDRDQFEVWVFQTDTGDDMAKAIAAAADHAVLLQGDLVGMQQQIASARLDALIYPDIGMEPLTYFLAFARLAPVQAVLWGHPMTTGIPNVDYFLSAEDMETTAAPTHYSEMLVRLHSVNTCFARTLPPEPVSSRRDLGVPEQGSLYVCPQSLFKFHPDFDRACMRILQVDSAGYLVLIEDSSRQWQEALTQRLQAIDAGASERVMFLPRMNEGQFHSLLACADVVIDPFHFGGGNTSLEAFAMGTPVVTLPSDYLRGRITYALYQQMGISDLIAVNPDQFVTLATEVAMNAGRRQELSQRIQAAWSAVFETASAVRELEAFLVAAVAKAMQGERLRHGEWS